MAIKILGISGSPRMGATEHALQFILQNLQQNADVEIEQINLAGKKMSPCLHCNACQKRTDMRCPVFDDDVNDIFPKMLAADVILCASPVYHMNPSPLLSILFSRTKPLSTQMRQGAFGFKIGSAIAVGGRRNGGQELAIDALNNVFLSMGMVICGGGVFSYHGAPVWSNDDKKAGVENDSQGLARLLRVGNRVLGMARIIKAGAAAAPASTALEAFGFSDEEEWNHTMSSFYE